MTEEIIIDGVNVAGCISFDKNNGYNICCYDDTREDKIPFANFCVENKDCYYKQLKRLEQERDELKFENDRYKQLLKGCPTEDDDCGFCEIDKRNKELEQENKELKVTMYRLESKVDSMCNCNEELNTDVKIFRSALEEIREMSKKSADVFDCTGCYDIYNKINEVLQ